MVLGKDISRRFHVLRPADVALFWCKVTPGAHPWM